MFHFVNMQLKMSKSNYQRTHACAFQKYILREIGLIIAYKLLTLFITRAVARSIGAPLLCRHLYRPRQRNANALTTESLAGFVEYISRPVPKEELLLLLRY